MEVHMRWVFNFYIYVYIYIYISLSRYDDGDDDGDDDDEHSHRVGPVAFQFRGSLTIELRVAVHHRRDSDQDLTPVPLHHQLQLAARLLDQLPSVAEGQVLRYCAVDLEDGQKV
ncbi:hypothetical protein AMECASPLE_035788 [Ameca splendens]|uniref:Secreted protein n=1 Tax=Ameca splendens TaxID=208324 RepID=A0ABV0YUR8_9TELE